MYGPAVVSWLLATLTGAAALFCLARLRTPAAQRGGTGWAGRESDAAEALMGIGMAVMALPVSRGGGVPAAACVVLFSGVGAWFLAAALRGGGARHRAHRLHHAVGSGAMVYMALPMATDATGGPQHAGHVPAAEGPLLLTGLLLLYFGSYVVWTGSRLLATAPGDVVAVTGGAQLLRAPGMPQACRVVMGMGMFVMLLAG
ncbi:DUF5134 domain-containing protein [Streptomyces thermocarboxydovorans]|uniref:DUF5134 domain-containing protein n=1 Tax=Streptomyces thermocarboxydovorans TaxID=59298 RepID=A0ABN1HWM6_9ACTN